MGIDLKNKQAFKKMRGKGIITPPLQIYIDFQRIVNQDTEKKLNDLIKRFKDETDLYDIERKGNLLIKDSIEDLLNNFKSFMFGEKTDYDRIKNKLRGQLNQTQDHFFKEFFDNADPELSGFIINLSLNKDMVFADKLEGLRELYLNNAIERIKTEKDELKKIFLGKMSDWIDGRSETLDIKDVMKEMNQTSVRQSKMFARDQLSKFNRALLVASFREAGVPKVEVITCHDRAVRGNPSGLYPKVKPSHYAWDGKVFNINDNNFMDEYLTAYNCRCGLNPIWE